jgi:peptidoglycan/xylan/chitin deacetylase (PgdA/CDA1 family)
MPSFFKKQKQIIALTVALIIGIGLWQIPDFTTQNLKSQTLQNIDHTKILGNTQIQTLKNHTKSNKLVAITIDDGYGNIRAFVDILAQHRIKATFFMLGQIADNNPNAMKYIVEQGHLLANHSYNHPEFTTLSKEEILWQLEQGRQALTQASGHDPFPYFRYPYGSNSYTTNEILAEQGWESFYWTQNTGDWQYEEATAEGAEFIYAQATDSPPDNAIVLVHTQSNSSLLALPDIIKYYRRHGYEFVTVDEL